jgi:4a-hydroxytetrahydrobiopterin dehydratase
MAELLSDEDVERRLAGVDGWRREDDRIVRDLAFEDFAAAMVFVNEVAGAAEAANHHPDILIHGWNKVRLEVTNHSAGGLTEPDFELAATIDRIAAA